MLSGWSKVHLDFSITSYGKSWTNFLANPVFNVLTHPMGQEFVSSLDRWLWLPGSHEVIVQMLAGFTVICRSGWAEGTTSSSVPWRLSGSLGFSPCRTPWRPVSLSASDLRDRQTEPDKREKDHDGAHRTFLWPDLQSWTLSLLVYSICQKWVTNSSPYSRGGRLSQAEY